MTIDIIDVGDRSVGISDLTMAKVMLDENMAEVLRNDKTVTEFADELKALIAKYCEPKNGYEYSLDSETFKFLYGDDVYDYY